MSRKKAIIAEQTNKSRAYYCDLWKQERHSFDNDVISLSCVSS